METMEVADLELIEVCYEKAVLLLHANSSEAGILAATITRKAAGRNYTAIFGRDAAICALGMLVSGDVELVRVARQGLATLAQYQAPNGQIPKYVKPETGEVDFWYTGCIDATLWWLIAVSFYDRLCPEEHLGAGLAEKSALALNWLQCQEHQAWYLLQQNEASDWADIMPRSGFVLYSNVLWHWVKRLYNLPTACHTRDYANLLFNPYGNVVPEKRRPRLLVHYIRNRSKGTPFYLSFVNFTVWGMEIDVFGNVLAALTGLAAPSRGCELVRAILALEAHRPFPLRVVGRPIQIREPLWRLYMHRHRQNFPWQYHNGGIWPFAGGFWVMLLARLGKREKALVELTRLARANQVNDWEFNEWFHGVTGEPLGMVGQSWNAAMFILAFRTVIDKKRYVY
ncbi:glycoside hydrolase [Geotalea daltonii FRC-32]|uniref:beta-fructofuranosidase n=1 Tax=Geotalea daltonii (strain DSM 22248 / JCM 15807 / FRC-32) TaxID=316067 RepID=B9LYX7_GEODF|nr:glycoside hydrolase 100 family protein [Geotalea daltonii]ACM18709.1 glycoside hydrolase [Geotalea daltonii FRC-32]